MRLWLCALLGASCAVSLPADDTPASAPDLHCPLYPAAQRDADQARFRRQREFQQFSSSRPVAAAVSRRDVPGSANFIDDYVFGRIAQDSVPIADRTTDSEFLRRVSLDLTGRIPTPDQISAFTADSNPDKRTALIDSLLSSSPFVDRWTQWYGDQFKVGSNYYNVIQIQGRNLFYRYIRDMLERDRPYNEFAAQIISAAGDNMVNPPVNYLARGFQQGDPIQDTYDQLTNNITQNFLGVQTICISCHNGRGHLEPINLFLLAKQRADFWRQSAFLSQTTVVQEPTNAYGVGNHMLFVDRSNGGYSSTVPSNNPGQRPARTGGPYNPVYLFNGAAPKSASWRSDLASLITADRQFARATVNFIWAKLFTIGIVDPPDNWDLARIDPAHPPAASTGFGLQPSNPQLLETLTDEFINSGYSVRHMIRLMVTSNAYQLSSRPPDGWRALYEPYFAKHLSRRLTAEEVFDAVTTATGTQTPMYVEGFDQPLMYATQLPDTTEPRSDPNITYFLSQFGRGDWVNAPRNSTSTVLQVLFLMNDNQMMARTLASRDGSRSTRVAQLLASSLSEGDMVNQLFLATLGRLPTSDEQNTLQKSRASRSSREDWLSDLQWALLNKLDFLFNY